MNSMVICLIIFAVMIILFFNRKIPMAFTSMGVIVALYLMRFFAGKMQYFANRMLHHKSY